MIIIITTWEGPVSSNKVGHKSTWSTVYDSEIPGGGKQTSTTIRDTQSTIRNPITELYLTKDAGQNITKHVTKKQDMTYR
jgi:hypothetical protein